MLLFFDVKDNSILSFKPKRRIIIKKEMRGVIL